MKESQVIVLTPRRRGRPRAPEPGSTISAWIPAKYHDRLIRIANEKDISVSAVVRTVIAGAFDRAHQKAADPRLKKA